LGIEKRALSGTVSGSVGFGVTLLQSVVAVPFLLSWWGTENYGLWLVFGSITSLLATLDTGHQNYLGNAFNQDYPKGEHVLKQRLGSGLRVALLLGGAQVIIAAILVATGTLSSLLQIAPDSIKTQKIDWAFLSMVLNWAVFGSVAGILVRLYPPYGLYAKSQWIGILQRFVEFAMLVGVAAFGGFLFEYSLVYWAFSLTFAAIWFPAIKREFPQMYPWWTDGSWKQAWENLLRSSVLTANGFITQFSMSGLNLIIAAQIDAATIPLFTTVRTLANTFSQAANILTAPLRPDIVRFHVQGDFDKLVQTFRACWLVSGSVINIGLVVVIPFIPILYTVWTRGKLEFNPVLFAMLALSVSIRTAYAPLAAYVTGMNRLQAQSVINTTQAALTIGMPLLLGAVWGLNAFGFGILVGELAAAAGFAWFSARDLGHNLFGFAKMLLISAVLPSAIVGTTLFLGLQKSEWALAASAIAAAILVVLYIRHWCSLPADLQNRFLKLIPIYKK